MSCKEVIYFSFVLVLTTSCTANSLSGRIVNGSTASPGEYPYAVSYRYFDNHNCGGSIIGKKWILTAAHCIHEDFNNVSSILFGTINIENGNNPVENVKKVARTIRNPLYQPYGGYRNDIGLVELTETLEYDKFIQPIKLPCLWYSTPAEQIATLVGWGYPMDDSEVLNQLHKVDIYVYSDKACKNIHGKNVTTSVHICAGIPEGGKGQCSGDSGGPLAIDGVQIGIVSWSIKPCAVKGFPGVFTRVSRYLIWIRRLTGI